MKKVLIIPSWYPTALQNLPGTFFREQAILVQEDYEIFVLYGLKKKLSFPRFGRRKRAADDAIITPPAGEVFFYTSIRKRKIYRLFSLIEKAVDKANFLLFKNAFESKLRKLIAAGYTPDLIHAQCTYWGGIAAGFLGEKYRIPTIITEHQVFLFNLYDKAEQSYIRKALTRVKRLLVVSEHQKRTILTNHIDCRPIVVGNMIDEDIFCLSETRNDKVFKILHVSYENWLKDNDTFFRAIRNVIDKGFTDIEVLMVGGNPWEEIQNPVV